MLPLAILVAAFTGAEAHTVLVEAEHFSKFGGWVHDSQFMDQMGSPFLLAHGLGVPVEDAVTRVELPAPGKYRVLVRTRDWVAPWNVPGAPGRFQVVIDGKPLETVFGTEGAPWHWQDGGEVEIAGRRVAVALHDLTGFAGRCDAILFTNDPRLTPPNRDPDMAAFRRSLLGLPETPEDVGPFDLVVGGGGIAGTCAAVAAARLGLEVALVQDRPVLGGNNSSEIRVWLQGARNRPPYPRVGDVVAELEQRRSAHYGPTNTAELYEDEKKLALVQAEKSLRLMLNCRVNQAETEAGRITAVVAQDTITARRYRLAGRWFADCTGDGAVGYLAGAAYETTLPGHMGRCNLWNVVETDEPVPFPRCPWALDLSDKPFPGRGKDPGGTLRLGGWYWESGFDHDPIEKAEYIRDWNFRAMYGAWDALKNVDKVYPNHKLNWAAHVSGKRESRRLLGDLVLTKEDLLDGRSYADGCVPTGWKIDLHLADPRYVEGFEGDGFISQAHFTDYPRPYWIPYRCLYSRNIANLFMAGRDISVSHEALGAVRVMRTGGCMGEIVGMAASLCKQHDVDPRDVYREHLEELKALMSRGVGRPMAPPKLENVGDNVARSATVTTSGDRDAEAAPPSLINDGLADLRRNELRWLSHAQTPNWIEFRWERPRTISAARILSGYNQGGQVTAPLESFVLQRYDNQSWVDVPATETHDNDRVDWHCRFEPLVAARIRLLVHATQIDISRVWEVELYEPAGE
jgi:hypothetical protein